MPANNGIQKQFFFKDGDILKMVNEIYAYLRDILVSNEDTVRITVTVKEKDL